MSKKAAIGRPYFDKARFLRACKRMGNAPGFGLQGTLREAPAMGSAAEGRLWSAASALPAELSLGCGKEHLSGFVEGCVIALTVLPCAAGFSTRGSFNGAR